MGMHCIYLTSKLDPNILKLKGSFESLPVKLNSSRLFEVPNLRGFAHMVLFQARQRVLQLLSSARRRVNAEKITFFVAHPAIATKRDSCYWYQAVNVHGGIDGNAYEIRQPRKTLILYN